MSKRADAFIAATKKPEQVFMVDSYDLDALVCKEFAIEKEGWSFQQAEEASNDTSHIIRVEGVVEEFDREDHAATIEGGKMYGSPARDGCGAARFFLEELCIRGKIPAGTYIVSVCW